MRKRGICLLLMLMMILAPLPFNASAAEIIESGSCGDNVTYTLDSDGLLTISGNGSMSEEPNGYPFVKSEKIKKIYISEGVTSINSNAFSECDRLVSVHIPKSVTKIDFFAFFLCEHLEEVEFSEGLETIGHGAFTGCFDLKSANIPVGVKRIEDNAFSNCLSLQNISLPNSLTYIGSEAFYSCKPLSRIVIPSSVKEIGKKAFMSSGLSEVQIKNASTLIGTDAFSYCSDLYDILYAGSKQDWDNLDNDYSISKKDIRIHFNVNDFDSHLHITEIKEPNCAQSGYSLFNCSCGYNNEICRATYDWDNHKWDSGKITRQPTNTVEGEKTFSCTRCGETRTERIPKLEPGQEFNPFADVKAGAYYYDPVLWAVNHTPQITNGTSATAFSPDSTCTRGQVVTFLWRAMNCPDPKSTNNPFTDVKAGDYYYKAVLWAAENGITSGTSKTTFAPGDPCTRAHVVTFLWRAHEKPNAGQNNPFTDVKTGQYYTDAVLWAVSRDITMGTDANHFSPAKPCTRGQIVTFLYRDMK